jgi:hypothetical protein
MFDVVFLLTTYNRPQRLAWLLDDIARESQGYATQTIIVDDGSSLALPAVPQALWGYCTIHRQTPNLGKRGYWRTVSTLWHIAKNYHAQYFCMLQDDVRLSPGFIAGMQALWDAIPDNAKACLNPCADLRRAARFCWTAYQPEKVETAAGAVLRTQWIDCLFWAPREFFVRLNWQIPPVEKQRWESYPALGSGVGTFLSQRLQESNLYGYHAMFPWVRHGGHRSQMHPRRQEVLTTEPIIAGMATYDTVERRHALTQVVPTILPQVDQLHVYWNASTAPPSCLRHAKITFYLSDAQAGDLTDFGKFYALHCGAQGYFFACDDDMLYPESYVAETLQAIERYQRQAIVGYHGMRIAPPMGSYYRERQATFHHKVELSTVECVQVLATCCAAWHTDTLTLSLAHSGLPCASDLHLAIAANRAGVPLVCLPHAANWLATVPLEETIYNRLHRNDAGPTALVNSHTWSAIPMPAAIEGE